MSAEAEVDRLVEDLRICRLELAAARAQQEPLEEELQLARHRLDEADSRVRTLSEHLNEQLSRLPSGTSPASRVARWALRRRRASEEEWEQVATILASHLFDPEWYLRHYPDTAATGLPPALHYLRHGAGEGLDPGPRFSTSHYLRDHPAVRSRGANPLLDRLRTTSETQGDAAS